MCRPLPMHSENSKAVQDEKLEQLDLKNIRVEKSYDGIHLTFPLTPKQLQDLGANLKDDQPIHAKYCIQVLLEAQKLLQEKPNINQATTALAKQITVCGE